jgi:hypothetical protein
MFLFFILFASLMVMNMLVGVLCQVVSAVSATESEEMLVNHVNEKISEVVALIDEDGSGSISKEEFEQIMDNAKALKCLDDVGVDVFALIDLADYIFTDESNEAIEIDFSRFMQIVLQLRGSNQATVKDLVDLRKFLRLSLAEAQAQTKGLLDMMTKDINRESLNKWPKERGISSSKETLQDTIGSQSDLRDSEGDKLDEHLAALSGRSSLEAKLTQVMEGTTLVSKEVNLEKISIDLLAPPAYTISPGTEWHIPPETDLVDDLSWQFARMPALMINGYTKHQSSGAMPILMNGLNGHAGDESSVAIGLSRESTCCPPPPLEDVSQAPIHQIFDPRALELPGDMLQDPRALDLPGDTLQHPANEHGQRTVSEKLEAKLLAAKASRPKKSKTQHKQATT